MSVDINDNQIEIKRNRGAAIEWLSWLSLSFQALVLLKRVAQTVDVVYIDILVPNGVEPSAGILLTTLLLNLSEQTPR